MRFLPDFSDWSVAAGIFIIPIAVQWWSAWYPGSEPGGGGYVAQRMLAAKNEKESMKATLWFNVAHYGLRPWPWIIVALCSMLVYPELSDIQARFPDLDPSLVGNDLAYPAMLVFLPAGLLGLVVASLAAAYMSTISTQLNWGASYVVSDFYRRFVNPDASQRRLVTVGRLSTVGLMVLGAAVALQLDTAGQGFQILLQIGAGTGLIFLLRWFWYRVNVWSELAGMTISFLVAIYFAWVHGALGFTPLTGWQQLVIGVAVTTVGWLAVTLVTPPADSGHAPGLLRQDPAAGQGLAPRSRRGRRAPGRRVDYRSLPRVVPRVRAGLRGALRDRVPAVRAGGGGRPGSRHLGGCRGVALPAIAKTRLFGLSGG